MVTPSICAVLARFGGDKNQAVDYCTEMAYKYPRLAHEYIGYRDALIHGEKAMAAHA